MTIILVFFFIRYTELQVGTQRIMGSSQWEMSAGNGMITRVGHLQFTVQHIKVTFVLSQPLDVRKKPNVNDIQIELGNIQVIFFFLISWFHQRPSSEYSLTVTP